MQKPEDMLKEFIESTPGLKAACDKEPSLVPRIRNIFLAGVTAGLTEVVKELSANGPRAAAVAALHTCHDIVQIVMNGAGDEEDVAEPAHH